MVINIAIVDDIRIDAQEVETQVRAFFAVHAPEHELRCTLHASGEDFLACAQYKCCFLVFLDIRLGAISGIDVARQIRRQNMNCLIVFLTSSSEYVWDAFPVHPFDYLLKPCSAQRVNQVLSEALRTLERAEPQVDIRIARGCTTVPVSHIRCAVSRDHALEVSLTTGETVKSRLTFAQLADLLRPYDNFLSCNRGVIINMDETLQFSGDCFVLRNGSRFPVRQRDRSALLRAFNAYQLDSIRKR